MQDSILRFSRLKTAKNHGSAGFGFRAFRAGPREGQGAGQAGRRQGGGAGHRGQGRVARFRFEVFQNLKNNIFATLGQGQCLRAGPRQGRAGRRAGEQAGCRAQGAGAGHKAQSRVARFHFEVFKA